MAARAGLLQHQVYFDNISATTAAFLLRGGLYGVDVTATFGGGSVTLEKLTGDGSTYVTALTAFSAAGYNTVSLPPGSYRFAVATATAVYVTLTEIASES